MNLPATKPFFIGIDSDGCVMDTMDLKQKECFCPNTIKFFGLQAVSNCVRQATEFVNLHSRWRGTNRFQALILMFDLLRERPEVLKRRARIPRLEALRNWVAEEKCLGNPSLKARVEAGGDPELARVLEWSLAVNRAIEEMAVGLEPFPGARECLAEAARDADTAVVSQTPLEALEREWREHGMEHLVRIFYGQEHGSKAEHLQMATGGRYAPERVLMLGDALGDRDAARQNGALFFPILPGAEEESWSRLRGEGLARFFGGTFQGAYQDALLREFEAVLPETPPWRVNAAP